MKNPTLPMARGLSRAQVAAFPQIPDHEVEKMDGRQLHPTRTTDTHNDTRVAGAFRYSAEPEYYSRTIGSNAMQACLKRPARYRSMRLTLKNTYIRVPKKARESPTRKRLRHVDAVRVAQYLPLLSLGLQLHYRFDFDQSAGVDRPPNAPDGNLWASFAHCYGAPWMMGLRSG